MQNAFWSSMMLIVITGCHLIGIEKGNGEVNSEKRLTDHFSEIHLTGNYEIGLKNGPKSQVVIVTDDNLLEYIETEVENEVLVVTTSKKLHSEHGIKIFVTYEDLNKLISTGASMITAEGPIVSERLEINIPGASLIDLDVDVTDLEIMLAGAGSVKLRGRAANQHLSLNGVGNVEAFNLESQFCEVTVSGMGGAEVNVKENLYARVNGVGSISYKGNPGSVDEKVSGLGTIRPVKAASDQDQSI
ncbi:MAG: DUF2807 domain-containing protein [Cyclobacteriaceae bacterium]|nr:MAG: DUF2807 domain-containing protein [Cyclobacteriaceae bacterium]